MSYLNPSKTDVRRRRILVGGASVIMTAIVMTGFLLESRWGYYSKPDPVLIYFQNWEGNRTRADAVADARATEAVQQAKLAQARSYIATLKGEARVKAQKQYDDYVAGDGADKETPYVRAGDAAAALAPAEPPVL